MIVGASLVGHCFSSGSAVRQQMHRRESSSTSLPHAPLPAIASCHVGPAEQANVLGSAKAACRASRSSTAQHQSLDQNALSYTTQEDFSGEHSLEMPVSNIQGSKFDWEKQWYPLAFIEDLNPKVPTPVQLLGQRLVLWRDRERQWRCFADVCPHRMAPLSEGRIEPSDGTLMCSYHGWRFQGDGKCADIPQALDEKANATACANQRSCATARPTQGKVWVWGQGGASAREDSRLVKPVLLAELADQWPPHGRDEKPWDIFAAQYMRDLPYGWATLVENIMDPAHVNFSHHNVIGDRSLPQWHGIEKGRPPESAPWPADSFQMPVTSFDYFAERYLEYSIRFVPPCQATWTNPAPKAGAQDGLLSVYAVPTAPGSCRVLFAMLYPRSSMPWLLRGIMALMPRYHKHLAFTAKVFDGDSALLHKQEVIALEVPAAKSSDYRKLYYMPTQSDRLVAAFRAWLAGRGGGGPVPVTERKELLPEHELLNHYDQHVRHCPSCSKALVMYERARHLAAGAGALCMLAMSAVLGRGAQLNSAAVLGLTAGAAVALALWLLMGPYIQRFRFVPYDHSM